ncbi:MAG: histidine kinase [Eubacterium sp.]|nr:histidine kinase [Eubacterium sp.]
MDLELLISENYITFLLLGGILIVMYAYREVRLPATGNFLLIIAVLFLMAVSNNVERWASMSPDRIEIRTLMSVIHYVLQPLVIYLELVIIMPVDEAHFRKRNLLLALPLILNTVIYLTAPFMGTLVFSYDEDYHFNRGPLGTTIYIVTFFYLALLLVWSIKLFQSNRRNGIILLFMIGAALLTGTLEGFNIASGYIDETFALGVFLYYMYLVTVHENQMQAELASKELKLSQSQIRLMREQMQPHFIFNSLQIIKSLIRTDQKKAVLCVEDFSEYLKANLDALKSDKLIPFEEELEHIEAYVSLSLADESKNIDIIYDIKEKGFMLPPFTVEPIVENALKHGVRNSGVIKIASFSDGNDILITVFDNGSGFPYSPDRTESYSHDHDTVRSEPEETGGRTSAADINRTLSGIGIKNARTRLEMLCNGSLDIRSGEDGTTVIIRVPSRRADAAAPHDNKQDYL